MGRLGSWSVDHTPVTVTEWLKSLSDDGSEGFKSKMQQVAIVLAAWDKDMPIEYSSVELYWEDLAIPIAHRQLQLEREFAEKEAKWAARLNEMQDGIERAVEWLNNASEASETSTVHVESCEHALAELNKVL